MLNIIAHLKGNDRMMAERLNLVVDDGTKAKLIDLAESERKMGEFISELVRRTFQEKHLSLEGLAANIDGVQDRLMQLEQETEARLSLLGLSVPCPVCGRTGTLLFKRVPEESTAGVGPVIGGFALECVMADCPSNQE